MSEKEKDEPEKSQTREERLERIKRLLAERGQDAAAVVKMWMSEASDERKQE